MDIKEIRIARLREWFSGRSIPAKEKSYISQLMNGVGSFGEKAARRLEAEYGMGDKYLDQAASTSVAPKSVTPNQVPPPAMLRKTKWDGIPDGPALDAALRDLEKRASPRSQAIIANLIALANKNALTDEDWEAIQWIAQRISH